MRGRIEKEIGVRASAGIACNQLLARMCTRKAKPNGAAPAHSCRFLFLSFCLNFPLLPLSILPFFLAQASSPSPMQRRCSLCQAVKWLIYRVWGGLYLTVFPPWVLPHAHNSSPSPWPPCRLVCKKKETEGGRERERGREIGREMSDDISPMVLLFLLPTPPGGVWSQDWPDAPRILPRHRSQTAEGMRRKGERKR